MQDVSSNENIRGIHSVLNVGHLTILVLLQWLMAVSRQGFLFILLLISYSDKILITPFRLQIVPPPMSSHELITSPAPSLSPLVPGVTTPIYITFSPEDDALGILWEHGYIELWLLKIRLQSGRGKVMDPSKKWSGWVAKYNDSNRRRFRELAVKTLDSRKGSYLIAALGACIDMMDDHISVTTIEEGVVISNDLIKLPERNSRLMTPFVPGMYEMHNGKIYTREIFVF